MKCLLATVFLTLCAATANASIIYDINRTIGEGTVTGSIQTDGTLGVLREGNIENWSITLFAPNLNAGNPYTFDITSGDTFLRPKGSTSTTPVSATSTELLYDFSTSGYFMLMSNTVSVSGTTTAYFWCLETSGCSGGPDLSEHIGHTIIGGSVADQWVQYTDTDTVVFATVTAVPVPAAAWLFASGLLGLVGFARRKR
jgi:hypothetical protein